MSPLNSLCLLFYTIQSKNIVAKIQINNLTITKIYNNNKKWNYFPFKSTIRLKEQNMILIKILNSINKIYFHS